MQSIPWEAGKENTGPGGSYGNEHRWTLWAAQGSELGSGRDLGSGRIKRHFVLEDKSLVTWTRLFVFFSDHGKVEEPRSWPLCNQMKLFGKQGLFLLPWVPGRFLEVFPALQLQVRELAVRDKCWARLVTITFTCRSHGLSMGSVP